MVIAVALILSRMQTEAGASKYAFRNILYCTLPICGLIFTENLSTACLLFGVVVLMMFIGRVSLIQIGKLLGVIVLLGMMGISPIIGIGSNSELSEVPGLHRLGTWSSRIESHFGEDNEAVKTTLRFSTSMPTHKLPTPTLPLLRAALWVRCRAIRLSATF